ncbi:unnamed protein product [Pneumocystis jirovecii]|uniref:Probable 26S proteasome regulatory subunit p27 n=1 Tax=Pneumocystis jirovecii TaxID=42068 RepID=L0PC08_PNEJI|nr:unnamed protein product [Pneumocystis jirovecii]
MGIPVNSQASDQSVEDTESINSHLKDIFKRLDEIKQELQSLSDVLLQHNVNMETPLIDEEGFPRSDIDVVSVRIARARINRLKNDYHALTNNIQVALHTLHKHNPQDTTQTAIENTIERPFARVNYIIHQSPAALAGLQEGDLIKRFGTIHAENHQGLSSLVQLVEMSDNKEIPLQIVRKEESKEININLTLIPQKNWGGSGSLGAHIVPI